MPVHLSVSQIREALFTAAGKMGKIQQPSAQQRLAGRLFHECFAALICSLSESPSSSSSMQPLETLEKTLYERYLGPRLIAHLVYLRKHTVCVRNLWIACRNMCKWLSELMESAASHRIELIFHPEEAFSITLSMPHWSDSIILSGVADLMLSIDKSPRWCLVELKLSQSVPELDLSQACLYHLMASQQMPETSGKLALVRFSPEKSETLLEEAELAHVRPRLIEWIGRFAGVREEGTRQSRVVTPGAFRRDFLQQAIRIEEIFHEYGLKVTRSGEPIVGPSYIRYPIQLGKGVKIGAVQKTATEIQHRLGLQSSPFIHLSEGQVFVDLQREDRQIVWFRDVLGQLRKSGTSVGCSRVLLGVDLSNRLHTADLSEPENAHLLVAGTTGSGKTEWLRCVIAGLIMTNTPQTLRLVIIDPKRSGFSELQTSPFLLHEKALVYPDEQNTADVLGDLADEMDRRYKQFEKLHTDGLDDYNRSGSPALPRIVCICDEYADLINRSRAERIHIESRINRLGQKARSAGIHLVIATQHPSRQIVKGTLDANLPSRVGFKMNRDIESKMVLNQRGAEHLLGNGDMLFKNIGEPTRLQAPLMGSEERNRIFSSNFYRENGGQSAVDIRPIFISRGGDSSP